MQSVRTRIAALSIAVALVAMGTGQAVAAFINLTPQGGANNSATSVKLSDLIDEEVEGIIVGDKVFTGFSYSRIGLDMPLPVDVNVLGFRDPNGHWGVSFHGIFWDLPGNGPSDALLRFMVEVDPQAAAEGWRITDAHLFLGGAGVPNTDVSTGEDSFISVDESFLEANEKLNTHLSSINGGSQQLNDWVYFPQPLTKLSVTKDILAYASPNSTQPARATVIDQSFSQTKIPEPSTVALLGFALTAFGWFGYRSRSAN